MTVSTPPVAPTGLTPELEVVLERFRLLARCRAAWLQTIWSSEETGGPGVVTHGEARSALEDRDSPAAESAWLESSVDARAWNRRLAELAEDEAHQKGLRLQRFARIFGLTREERDLFEACLAVSLDPSLARLCAFLQDHAGRAYMTETLASRLHRHGRVGPWQAESALFRWELISRRESGGGEPAIVSCDPQIRDWLCGREGLDEVLASAARLCIPREPLRSWPVEKTLQFLRPLLGADPPERARIVVCGPAGSGRRTFSAVVAAQLGFPLLVVDADAADDAGWSRLVLRAVRHAFLERCAPAFVGESLTRRPWPVLPTSFPVEFLILRSGQEVPSKAGCAELRIDMPVLSLKERVQLWHTCLPESREWPRQQFHSLVARQRTTVGEIAAVARVRVHSASEARRLLRRASRSRFGHLAQRLECPFGPDDLVVNTPLREALDDFVFEARVRGRFWERKSARQLFPQGRGLLALFSGPPGTGKTMAAQVIARELGLDLFRVDLANVTSKWVGETAKNLDDVVRRAAETDALLMFDECDAAFARRTTEVHDAQDRFANTDTAQLLQAIEGFPGIALLATNQKSHIDPAFVRRLRYILEFPRPLAPQRLELWRKLVSGLAGDARMSELDRPLDTLASIVEMTGAQIKFAVLAAVFAARRERMPLGVRHLIKGLERELAKESRVLGTRERERILSSGA